jgi:tRNA(adenine34) deaminase
LKIIKILPILHFLFFLLQRSKMKQDHIFFMNKAIALANEAGVNGEVPIGALVVDENDNIIGTGFNRPIIDHDPSAHAEIMAIRAAAKALENYRLTPKLRLYVTLEPCNMCAGAISFARIEHLIFGAYDKKGGAIINGTQFFNSPTCHFRPQITHGILENECSQLLKSFFSAKRNK